MNEPREKSANWFVAEINQEVERSLLVTEEEFKKSQLRIQNLWKEVHECNLGSEVTDLLNEISDKEMVEAMQWLKQWLKKRML